MTEAPSNKPDARSTRDDLYLDPIKEHRGAYLVEYQPPVADARFATIDLVFVDAPEDAAVAAAMKEELQLWLKRYPVPLMVTAWDAKGNTLRPNGESTPHLVGWLLPNTTSVVDSWQTNDLDEFLKSAPPPPHWRMIYNDVPVKTDAEFKENAARFAQERRRQNRYLRGILFLWIACSAGVALFQYFGPEWLGLIALIFSLGKAGRAAYRLWRNSKPTPWEAREAEKKRKMDHYYHHCERNPLGFVRLKAENFERDMEERTRRETGALAKREQPEPGV